MKKPLLIAAICIDLATLSLWLATGAHRGWTKTREIVMEIDPVTGQENNFQRDKFVMGVELLAAGLLGAGVLAGAALVLKSKPDKTS